jgi:nucleoside-diphosphate-sugar epimerase
VNDLLLGHRGFVGSNLAIHFPAAIGAGRHEVLGLGGHTFSNIYCAAPQAKKWWANQNPGLDKQEVLQLVASCKQLNVKGLFYLFGTVDVYDPPHAVDETVQPSLTSHPYGAHRAWLENELLKIFGAQMRIIRLPALVGNGLKKNIIYDLLNNNNISQINPNSAFQWFNLSHLPDIIRVCAERDDIPSLNVVSEPLHTLKIVERWFQESRDQLNWGAAPINYDVRTVYGTDGFPYLYSTDEILSNHLGPYILSHRSD